MGSDMQKPDGAGRLFLKGALTIEHAGELRQMLIDAFKKTDSVKLNLEDVTEVDLSCLQLLCSAHRTSLDLNKQLLLDGGQPESFQQAIRDAGFTRPVGCRRDPHQSCLWIGGLE